MPLGKIEHSRSTLTVRPGGALEGHTFVMRRVDARTWIALQAGELGAAQLMAAALDAVVDSTMPDDLQLDVDEATALGRAWSLAHTEDAVPPASGTGSGQP